MSQGQQQPEIADNLLNPRQGVNLLYILAVGHSKYDGYPALALKLPFVRTEGSAKSLEPVFCILAGAALCPWSEAVGAYVFLGFASLLVVRAFETQSTVNRVRAMQDAAIEQRNMASMFRGDFHVNDF